VYSLHSRCSERLIVYRLFEIKSHIDCAILLRAITKLKAATPPFDTKECGGPCICSQQTNGFRADRTVDLLQSVNCCKNEMVSILLVSHSGRIA